MPFSKQYIVTGKNDQDTAVVDEATPDGGAQIKGRVTLSVATKKAVAQAGIAGSEPAVIITNIPSEDVLDINRGDTVRLRLDKVVL